VGNFLEHGWFVRFRKWLSRLARDHVREPVRRWRRAITQRAYSHSAGVTLEPGADAFPDSVYVASLPPPLTQTCVIGPEAIRVRPDPLSLLPPTEEARIYAEREAEAPALTLMAPGAHFWFPKNGLMITAEGRVCPYSFPGDRLDEKLRAFNQVVWRTRESGTEVAVFHPEAMRNCPVIADEALLVSTADRANFGHYLLDMAPLILWAVQNDQPMLSWPLAQWQREISRRLGVRGNRLREIAARPTLLRRPVVSNRHKEVNTWRPHPRSRDVFAAIRSSIGVTSDASLPRRFFVARSQRHSRGLKNRAAVIDALALRYCRRATGTHEFRRPGRDVLARFARGSRVRGRARQCRFLSA
jgi:hypothetical protein